jgi:predicted glutamine amidotransferase
MCVIAVKKKGIAMPSNDSIKAMWEANSDGAGFMYALDGQVFIKKGFMKLTDMTKAILSLEKNLMKKGTDLTNVPMVMHFRITTHGGTSAGNTHPFAITKNEKMLTETDVVTDLGLAHNGIIHSVDTTNALTLSDTMVYITDVLAPLKMLSNDFYKTTYGKELMENTIGYSKFAFLDKNGDVELVGDFKHGTSAGTSQLLFSNLSHEYPSFTSYKGRYNYGYAFDDAYDYTWKVDEDYLKPISKDDHAHLSPVSIMTDKSVIVEELLEVKVDDLWYMNMDNEVFMKVTKDGQTTYVQSTKFARAVKYNKAKKEVYVLFWDDLKTKTSIVGKIKQHNDFDLTGKDVE